MTSDGSPRLTTHVLDLTGGRPAAGLAIELARLDPTTTAPGAAEVLRSVTTNDDGRTDGPLLVGEAFGPGRYELRFDVGGYFAAVGGMPSEDAYLEVVPVRFAVRARTGSIHVALLITPWSYTTYRGS